ncbi:19639_t:CDS:2 [Funneliformis geosporum]|uniref:15484_t:CDS:1 n=1 Tax=Funneliformis geosporum TaxID=1117311 RepID=A0A9W4SP47_9GLOM|nr:19639_t:CDS:2 [Funneliformis geosporum]CAI2176283.1 15484_t:CDS:2 [Funneliformis geosporum]
MISTNLEQYKSKRQQKLAQKQSQLKPSTYTTQTPFRDAERNFKSRLPPPDFSNVIDFYNLDQCNDELKNRIIKIELKVELGENGESENLFGDYKELKEEEKDFIKGGRRTAYLFKDLPGFIFIPNPFTPKAQKHIIKRCLRDFAKYPNKGNLDTHYLLPKEGLWNLHENIVNNDLNENHPQYFIPLKASVIGPTNDSFLNEEQGEQCSSFSQPRPEPPPSSGVPILTSSQLIKKIRWTTLGYQYHWPTKTYHLDKRLSFPKDIELLTTFVIKSIYGVKFITSEKKENEEKYFINDYDHKKWKPEAGVVNYYQLKDNLMAHVDKSEINMEAPLISFSFGHTCIFLIGGSTRDIAPIALYLRSGDISIMCGPCRANFHGVPRILEGTLPKYLEPYYDNDSEWNTYGDYMSSARINVNVRQVF